MNPITKHQPSSARGQVHLVRVMTGSMGFTGLAGLRAVKRSHPSP
jgi:hypothetical protein